MVEDHNFVGFGINVVDNGILLQCLEFLELYEVWLEADQLSVVFVYELKHLLQDFIRFHQMGLGDGKGTQIALIEHFRHEFRLVGLLVNDNCYLLDSLICLDGES